MRVRVGSATGNNYEIFLQKYGIKHYRNYEYEHDDPVIELNSMEHLRDFLKDLQVELEHWDNICLRSGITVELPDDSESYYCDLSITIYDDHLE